LNLKKEYGNEFYQTAKLIYLQGCLTPIEASKLLSARYQIENGNDLIAKLTADNLLIGAQNVEP